MTQHTQGEWTVEKFEDETLTIMSGDRSICDIIGIMKTDEANARLIAASPQLLSFAKLVAAGHLSKEGFVDAAKRTLALLQLCEWKE